MTTSSIRRARAGLALSGGILALGLLAAACAPGTRANSRSDSTPPPATLAPASIPTPAAGASGPTAAPATQNPAAAPTDPSADPLTAADTQSADQSLSQIEGDLSSTDQATATGENDVPSN